MWYQRRHIIWIPDCSSEVSKTVGKWWIPEENEKSSQAPRPRTTGISPSKARDRKGRREERWGKKEVVSKNFGKDKVSHKKEGAGVQTRYTVGRWF